jgi:SAM-dependent methyltransferase
MAAGTPPQPPPAGSESGSTGSSGAAAKDPLTEPGPWNSVAVGYDEEFFEQLPGVFDKAIAVLDAPPESTVLDLATGPGTFAVPAARRFEKVVAIDFAEQMIERLRGHLERSGIGNVEALVMDGHALSFGDASFDAVVSMFGWFLFADRSRSLAEIHRVLRPGGRVLVASWATPDRNTVLGVGMEGLRSALPDLPRPAGPLPTQVPEICAAELRSAGFCDVNTTLVTVGVNFESVDAYWRTMQRAGAPMVLLRKKMGEEAFEDAARRAREHIRGKLGTGSVALGAEAIFTSGTRGD